MKIVITGANGFLGQYLLKNLQHFQLIALARSKPKDFDGEFYQYDENDVDSLTKALIKSDVIVHCAAKTAAGNIEQDLKNDYKMVNVDLTLHLARQAIKAGVKRFIFISSLKVNGEETSEHLPFTCQDKPNPHDYYAQSKYQAEQGLLGLVNEPDCPMDVVIIRPPLIYGPGCQGNFLSLLNLIYRGYPLPFASIVNNRRSLVSVDNLTHLIEKCFEAPQIKNKILLVSDDSDLSTCDMVRMLAKGANKKVFMLSVPIWCYRLLGKLFNKQDRIDRLVGSLQADITETKRLLHWNPPQSVEKGFQKVAQFYQAQKEN